MQPRVWLRPPSNLSPTGGAAGVPGAVRRRAAESVEVEIETEVQADVREGPLQQFVGADAVDARLDSNRTVAVREPMAPAGSQELSTTRH